MNNIDNNNLLVSFEDGWLELTGQSVAGLLSKCTVVVHDKEPRRIHGRFVAPLLIELWSCNSNSNSDEPRLQTTLLHEALHRLEFIGLANTRTYNYDCRGDHGIAFYSLLATWAKRCGVFSRQLEGVPLGLLSTRDGLYCAITNNKSGS